MLIAKVDCDAPNAKATAEKLGVKSYPTIFYFAKGSDEPTPYTGGRSEQELVQFINVQAGTYRSVGGGLTGLAGTIPSLKEAVDALRTSDYAEKAFKELYKQAGNFQDKYAEYYAKVGKKLQENKEYVEKEYTRLSNMIAKGNLAPEKKDDLTTRKNILEVFREKVEEAAEAGEEKIEEIKDEL